MDSSRIHLRGTRREIGEQLGRRIRGLSPPPPAPGDDAFGVACRHHVERLHPAMIDEYEGMLSSSGQPADAFANYCFGRTAPLAGGCTNLACVAGATATGRTIVGRNYDWAYADRRWRQERLIEPRGEASKLGYTHHWGGMCDVMNDRGVVVCIASLPPDGPMRPGLQWHIVVDLVATQCVNARDAADLIVGVPHVRSLSYLVADDTDAYLVEASSSAVTVHESVDGIIVGTNHRLDEPARSDARGRLSRLRRERTLDVLQARSGAIDREVVVAALTDHEAGVCSGRHGEHAGHVENGGGFGTIWSLIAEPSQRRIGVAAGHPCVTPFEELSWLGTV